MKLPKLSINMLNSTECIEFNVLNSNTTEQFERSKSIVIDISKSERSLERFDILHGSNSSICTSTLTPLLCKERLDLEHEDDISVLSLEQRVSGYGEKTFSSGARYAGEFKDGKMDGYGKYIYKGGGASYNGQWKDDQRHGLGKAIYQDGTMYVGEFADGKMHGRGKKTWPDGREYIGDWKYGMYNGEGTYTNLDGDTYKGNFKDDKKHGMGTMRYACGSIWFGQWQDGEKLEEKISIDCRSRPSSSLTDRSAPQSNQHPLRTKGRESQRHHHSEKSISSTRSTSSEKEDSDDDSLHSYHSRLLSVKEYDGDDVYEGQLKNDMRNGWGTMRYGDGDIYTGEWVHDKRHGSGKYEYATGTVYVGQWSDGKWNGDGKYSDGHGTTYIGQFKNYKKDGVGEITYPDGTKWNGIWKDGEKLKEQTPRFKFDAFFSHNWGNDKDGRDNHERVMMICQKLEHLGYKVWFDGDQMRGDILDRMTEGIDNSMLFVPCVTQKYLRKVAGKGSKGANDNCKIEFGYAMQRKGVENMIPVVMESSCNDQSTWEGAVGGALINRLYMSFTGDDGLDECVKKLVEEIECKKEQLY